MCGDISTAHAAALHDLPGAHGDLQNKLYCLLRGGTSPVENTSPITEGCSVQSFRITNYFVDLYILIPILMYGLCYIEQLFSSAGPACWNFTLRVYNLHLKELDLLRWRPLVESSLTMAAF